jgi:uncharacterized protein
MHHGLKAFFEHGLNLNKVQVLVETGSPVDLDPAELRTAPEQGTDTERVLRYERQAHDLGLTTLPALLIHRCDQLLKGAQPFNTLMRSAVLSIRFSSGSPGSTRAHKRAVFTLRQNIYHVGLELKIRAAAHSSRSSSPWFHETNIGRVGSHATIPKSMTKRSCRLIGVVSDTHGLMRPQALAALRGAELIIHAGDIGSPDVLDALRGVASVVAIRGNVDRAPWANALAETEVVDLNGALIYVLHNIQALDLDPQAAGFRAVVFGHSHKPLVEQREDVLYLNPGSIGPRRFTLPITLARLHMDGSTFNAEIVELKV